MDSSTSILVTNDDPQMLRLIESALGNRYRCDFIADVEQARERIESSRYQVILCDVQIAGGSGLSLAEEISEGHPDVAVVLITGEDHPELAEKAFTLGEHGVHGYLVKPFWPGQLVLTVMNALRRRELEQSERSFHLNLEQRRQTIIDRAPLPIYVKDEDLRYVFSNPQADVLAGQTRGGLLGKTDLEIMPAATAASSRAVDRRILATATTHEAEEIRGPPGAQRTFKTVKFPLLDEDGKATAVCGISTDVTPQMEELRLRDELAAAQQDAIDELSLSREETVERLSRAIELHDLSTGRHVERMGKVAALLGAHFGLEPEQVQLLRLAAPMHDVGKIATPSEILRKPGPLSAAERGEMSQHTTVGHEILSDSRSALLRVAATIALTHHERFDGSGYPHGLAGAEIPLEGRITAVADVFDALLSDRPYRPAFGTEEAVEMIRSERGAQFDPAIVDLLLDHLDEALALRQGLASAATGIPAESPARPG